MSKEVLIALFDRDLARLREEVENYNDEANLWKKSGEIPNSAGNLALHLVGNLKHFLGAILGNSGYERERDLEFLTESVARTELLTAIDETAAVVRETLEKLPEDALAKDYPIVVFKEQGVMSTNHFLTHLTTHLNYHLGQINYHRRLLDE